MVRRRDQLRYEQDRRDLFRNSSGGGDVNVDLELAEGESLDRSSSMVQGYLTAGQETLHELLSQKDRLKGVQRRVLDIMGYLGVSASIMKAVERREAVDKWIVYGGMMIVSAITFSLWWYLR
jgi:golgi SNAP receptor complex member 2